MRLNTFGRAHIVSTKGEEVALQPLAIALLAYLATSGPRDREHLAQLFWHNSKNGLNSLSTTLNRIRAHVPDGVWTLGNTQVGTNLPSDVAELRAAIDESDLETVAHLYVAPFLGSLRLRRQSVEFEEWVLDQRTTLATTVELALFQRGRDLYEAGEYQNAAIVAEEAWDIAVRDGFPSPEHFEAYHRILASAERPSANAVRSMADEFGIELTPVEPVSFELGKESVEIPFVDNDRSDVTAAPLFGCQRELDAIASSVTSEKLTTIVGLGGSGKTRLAAEFFSSSEVESAFPRRYWVNLRDVAEPDLVAPAVATSIGQRFESVTSLAEQLADGQPVLLVLDNFEEVLESSGIVAELTAAGGAIRILVTSRVPLEVAEESLVKLTGLDIAVDEPHLPVEELSYSPAEQLFVASARRSGVHDDLTGSSRAAVRDVCRRVGGNPLALEIAGGWTQILSPVEILDALSIDNELLGSPMVSDLRSMDMVLKQSWSTLAEAEQNTLMLLAVFPAGCLTREALTLAELSISSIGRLVQHSLVRLENEDRITLHPLIASHALHELEQRPELRNEFHRVLSDWCQNYVAATQTNNNGAALDTEIANFASAWSWNARHGLWELHRVTVGPLRQFFNESGRFSEGRALFESTANTLRAEANPPGDLVGAVLEALGWFQLLSGESAQARQLFAEALTLTPSDDPHARAQILRSLSVLNLFAGEADEAVANLTAGLALIGEEPSALTASLQYDLAQAYRYRGDRDQAATAARLALRAGRAANDWLVMTTSYLLLADIEVESDPGRAIVLLNEGWVVAKDASLANLAIYFPLVLGRAHLKLDEADVAESFFTDGIDAAKGVGQTSTVSANHIGRAEARLLSDDTPGATEDLTTAIRLALKTGSGAYLMWAAVVSCRALATRQGPNVQAKELLVLTLHHSATDQDARDKAIDTLRDVFGIASPADLDTFDEGDDSGLDEIAERALQILMLC